MEKRRTVLRFKRLEAFKSRPRRDKDVELGVGELVDVRHSPAVAEDRVRRKAKACRKALKLAEVPQPKRILHRRRGKNVHQALLRLRGAFGEVLVKKRLQHPVVPLVVAPLKARRVGVDYRLLGIGKLACHLGYIIADNLLRAAGEHDEQIRVDDLQRVFNRRAEFFFAAEDHFFFADAGAGKDVRREGARGAVVVVEFRRAARPGVEHRYRAGNGMYRLHRGERTLEARLIECLRHYTASARTLAPPPVNIASFCWSYHHAV